MYGAQDFSSGFRIIGPPAWLPGRLLLSLGCTTVNLFSYSLDLCCNSFCLFAALHVHCIRAIEVVVQSCASLQK